MAYWLFKSEPNCFSIDDLKNRPGQTEHWDGVRNYQARNFLRDQIQVGDQAFFYHSNCDVPGIVGIIKIVKKGYPDYTAFNPEAEHYDPQSNIDHPRWYMVDVKFVRKFKKIISLSTLKQHPVLKKMQVARKGNRLSITPVSAEEWRRVVLLLNR